VFRHGCAVRLRVRALGGVLAGPAAGADSTRTALIFRVGVVGKVSAGTFETRSIASLALTTTWTVAAVAVNAVPASAFDIQPTGFTDILLLYALAVDGAVEAEAAVILLGTCRPTFAAVVGASVTFAGIVATVGADAAAITGVRVEDHAAHAVLREALGAIIPVSASTATITVAIVTTGSLGHGGTVIDRVGAVANLGALVVDTSADPARRAVIFGVCQTGVVRTGTFLVFQRARLATELARPVAAVTVDAEASETLVMCITGFALGLALFA